MVGKLAGFLNHQPYRFPTRVGDFKLPPKSLQIAPFLAKQPGYFTPISGAMGPLLIANWFLGQNLERNRFTHFEVLVGGFETTEKYDRQIGIISAGKKG